MKALFERYDPIQGCIFGLAVIAIVFIVIILWPSCARAEEIDKTEIPKNTFFFDGVYLNLADGSHYSLDAYLNDVRRDLHKWERIKDIRKYFKRIRTDANFCVLGIDGDTPKDRREKLHIGLDNQKIFEKAFSFLAKEKGVEKSLAVYNPDDFIWIVARMIPDCSKLNVPFMFTFVTKKDAYDLGCRDKDVLEYMNNRK